MSLDVTSQVVSYCLSAKGQPQHQHCREHARCASTLLCALCRQSEHHSGQALRKLTLQIQQGCSRCRWVWPWHIWTRRRRGALTWQPAPWRTVGPNHAPRHPGESSATLYLCDGAVRLNVTLFYEGSYKRTEDSHHVTMLANKLTLSQTMFALSARQGSTWMPTQGG